jgi:hypothetical protein
LHQGRLKAAYLRTKGKPAEGRTQIGSKFPKGGFPLPFRSLFAENRVENYQRPENKSTRLT